MPIARRNLPPAAKGLPLDKPTPSELLKHRPLPELAAALRSRIGQIIQIWVEEVRREVPSARQLSFEQLQDNLPAILGGMADALESANGGGIGNLKAQSPAQGIPRFHQNYNIRELMTEDRLLRRIIIEQTESALGRRMTLEEQVALAMAIDVMLQQAVVAFVDHQNARITSGAESELKYLSFLSHDLNNNLGAVTLFMQVLRRRLAAFPEFAQDVETLDQAQHSILDTTTGMQRLLQSERLRKSGVEVKHGSVNLHRVASSAISQLLRQAEKKGVRIAVEVPSDAVVHSDAELITLALQNLAGNAVKYSQRGVVRVGAKQGEDGDGRWVVWVSDEGPGIAEEHQERIFEAFRRGESHGQAGVGLGLTIASQAAKLLEGELTVESTVGVGSTFRLALPAEPDEGKR
jgi:signal transduction histidine kinase